MEQMERIEQIFGKTFKKK